MCATVLRIKHLEIPQWVNVQCAHDGDKVTCNCVKSEEEGVRAYAKRDVR